MQHPFINDLSDMTMEQLSDKLQDLTKKLNFAMRMQNGPMIHQLSMVVESYKMEYNKKMDEMFKKQNIQTTVKVQKEGELDRKND
jgi:hypothetical protein